MQQEITGIKRVITKVISYDGKTGECLFTIVNDSAVSDPFTELRCKTVAPFLYSGMPLELSGTYINEVENKTEPYIKISESKLCTMDENSMSSFLKTIEPSIRKNNYRKFLRKYGNDIFTFIERPDSKELIEFFFAESKHTGSDEVEDEEETSQRRSLGTDLFYKLSAIASSFKVFYFLQRYGVPASVINRACAGYPTLSIDKIIRNPYSFVSDFDFPFLSCDLIALQNGIDCHDDMRTAAIIKESMRKNEADGNTCTTVHSLKLRANQIVKQSYLLRNPNCSNVPDNECIDAESLLYSLSTMKGIVFEKEENHSLRIYLEKTWYQETCIAKHRKRLDSVHREYNFDIMLGRQAALSDEQDKCLNALRTSGIKILIGGPGTGKTTTIGEMVRIFHANFPEHRIALCAPTGRASQKMKEVSDNPAMTAQKLINFKPYGDGDIVSEFDENNNLPYDLIIADEWSMGDTELTAILLRAVKNGAIVIFSGDVNQLDSVGCGSVLSDFIASGVMEVYRLTKIFRQQGDNLIVKNAYRVIRGETDLEYDEHFERYSVKSAEEMPEKVLAVLKQEMKTTSMDKIQVLCTYKKRGAGVGSYELNEVIKSAVNPNETETISVGDKAIMLKNNYKKGYFNGDAGIVTKTAPEYMLAIYGNTLTINYENLCDMALAYAITVHKAQGSEYPVTIIVLPKQFRNLRTRNLLYTAITRAKSKVIIIDEEGILEDTIMNISKKRLTGLADKLRGKKIRKMEVNAA